MPPLKCASLVRRYKRFLADIELEDGSVKTIHCPNTGSMKACIAPGSACWYSTSDNPKRKYPDTWEIATTPDGDLAGINTGRANSLVREAIEAGVVSELKDYDCIRAEVKYGREKSRIDFLLSAEGRQPCYVEVKNVTLCLGGGLGAFPDAVSERGTKHLRELTSVAQQGDRAVILFCVQHSAIQKVRAAVEIDPAYAEALKIAHDQGVEVLAYGARLSEEEIVLNRQLQVIV